MTYKDIPCTDLAEKLGLERGTNENYHCFNEQGHNNGDQNPSLQISEDGFKCHGCGLHGNNIELIKLAKNVSTEGAYEWMRNEYPEVSKNGNTKIHLRMIKDGEPRFLHVDKDNLKLREADQEDIKNIEEMLGKRYSLDTLHKTNTLITDGNNYAMVFDTGTLEYNPNNKKDTLFVEGRTDWLTAVELGFDNDYNVVSVYNKTMKIELKTQYNIIILDADDDPEGKKTRLTTKDECFVKFIRLPEGFKDLSDLFYDESNAKDIVQKLIDESEWIEISPERKDRTQQYDRTIRTAKELMMLDLPPITWVVPNLLPSGLTIIAGKPKTGKSLLALNIAVAVSTGRELFSQITTNHSQVVYFALEDNEARLQDRIDMISGCYDAIVNSEDFKSSLDIQRYDIGGLEYLVNITKDKDVKLVIIDTWQRFAPPKTTTESDYEFTYRVFTELSRLAKQNDVALILIHHARKNKSDSNYTFDEIMGSTGITASVDTMMVLSKVQELQKLEATGRDVESAELLLKFDKTTLTYTLTNTPYDDVSPERQSIIDLMDKVKKEFTVSEIADTLDVPKENLKGLLSKMARTGQVKRIKRGVYTGIGYHGYQAPK
jgi:archaellum biogenesis ATPase FlaH